jgi:hypothetical protein
LQPLAQARVEQRAWTVLLTGRIRAGARGGLYERDRPHSHIISQTAGESPNPRQTRLLLATSRTAGIAC